MDPVLVLLGSGATVPAIPGVSAVTKHLLESPSLFREPDPWKHIWPKDLRLASDAIAGSLARMSVAARDEFPAALRAIVNWLRPVSDLHSLVRTLHDTHLPTRFPAETFSLLKAIVDAQVLVPPELAPCLNAIASALPELLDNKEYTRLLAYSKRPDRLA